MPHIILLSIGEDTKQVEAEMQARFVKLLLESIEVPIEFNPDEPLTVESKLKLRKDLQVHNIQIIDDLDGGLKVYVQNEKIGEFFKCSYKVKEDLTALDPNKKLFLEMQVNFSTIFENTE